MPEIREPGLCRGAGSDDSGTRRKDHLRRTESAGEKGKTAAGICPTKAPGIGIYCNQLRR